jgi:uncharacterized protein UPF0158
VLQAPAQLLDLAERDGGTRRGAAALDTAEPGAADVGADFELDLARSSALLNTSSPIRRPSGKRTEGMTPVPGIYPGSVLELKSLNLEEIADALADQTDYEHHWLINPDTGEVVFWTADTGIDGQTPVDLDDLDLVGIGPLPSWVWYQDMADFAEAVTDEQAGRRLARAIRGKGAFRRFKEELYEEYPDLLPTWYAFRDARARRRAVQWLADNSLIDEEEASQYLAGHPEPDVP